MTRYSLPVDWMLNERCPTHDLPCTETEYRLDGDLTWLRCRAGHDWSLTARHVVETHGTALPDVTEVPTNALRSLIEVAAHVSAGREAAFASPYPDAKARMALGALDDAGILDEIRES